MSDIHKEIAICQKCGESKLCFVQEIQPYKTVKRRQLVYAPGTNAVVMHGAKTMNTYHNQMWADVNTPVKDGHLRHASVCEACIGTPPTTSLKKRFLWLTVFIIATVISLILLVLASIGKEVSQIVFSAFLLAVCYLGMVICMAKLLRSTPMYLPSILLSLFGYGLIVVIVPFLMRKSIRKIENENLEIEHRTKILLEVSI